MGGCTGVVRGLCGNRVCSGCFWGVVLGSCAVCVPIGSVPGCFTFDFFGYNRSILGPLLEASTLFGVGGLYWGFAQFVRHSGLFRVVSLLVLFDTTGVIWTVVGGNAFTCRGRLTVCGLFQTILGAILFRILAEKTSDVFLKTLQRRNGVGTQRISQHQMSLTVI